ncbi:hypothetical protein QCA50_011428 [Cerrena zonata]|uniref:Uncharacterized protein n=1 Tax=Cerrena zonata TaxID=2478898 RepID=A0AAW0G7D1_9APHY
MARERRAFWHPPFKSSQFLYFIIRYAPLISRIPVLIKGIARFDAASDAVRVRNRIIQRKSISQTMSRQLSRIDMGIRVLVHQYIIVHCR